MYCPNCSQLVPDNTRFCSRCGLSLSELAAWLAGHGALTVRKDKHTPRRKGMRWGAKIMFASVVMFPIFLLLSLAGDSPFPLFIPFLIFFAGLSIMLYSRIFIEEVSANGKQHELRFGVMPANVALPPASDTGVITPERREVRTAEIIQPPSVTDHTTKLLDRE